ncbi:hypothetical protein ASU31_11905 [Pedobacter ginsenosidimutans]|uniref:Uncharacterized protein n=1 Tax=Pedobacter ginsenosidimutans TaxID=687842 RepID=A0A0T5VPE6_9SPHI|nr:hypothetical protein [Pedobacter ginsenosidimutans]KRT15688.1 hypothetical protein ASU31_11905 [Pedobacter ginsenosidimutans]
MPGRASDPSSELEPKSGTEACQEPQAICFLIKKLSISFRAQSQYNTLGFFPFYAYTLRFLVPRCCRVTLQPGLLGQISISFPGLPGAENILPKPDCSGSLRFFSSAYNGTGLKLPKAQNQSFSMNPN